MKTTPDPIDDIRHALRVVGLIALVVSALCVVRVVSFALAGDWLTAACNAVGAIVFGSAWISTEVRADRYSGASWAPLDVTRARVVTRTTNTEETP